ncbi:hypothetical protein A2U01_0061090, partial [Trifolium medium]|nr:hypothetical protein [Trifolium medium]
VVNMSDGCDVDIQMEEKKLCMMCNGLVMVMRYCLDMKSKVVDGMMGDGGDVDMKENL